ncbi:hypothetical protein [Streptomyces sp. NPDC058726]|uniref:hypothetical protein n=1 Tax=Streptomyces sp. NPDC058726 TaxID=3346611 RepID=UPI00368C82DF
MAGDRRVYLCEDGVLLADVRCGSAAHGWSPPRPAPVFGLVLLRDGVLRARVDGVEQVLDTGSVYVERLGAEQQFAHPLGPDAYTGIVLSEPRVAELLGGDPAVPEGLVMVTPELALAHRVLLSLPAAAGTPTNWVSTQSGWRPGSSLASLPPGSPPAGPPRPPRAGAWQTTRGPRWRPSRRSGWRPWAGLWEPPRTT